MKRRFLQLLCMLIMGQVTAQQKGNEMTDLLVQYEADKGSLRRFYFIDYSPERTERLKVFSKDYQQQLSAINF